MRYNDTGFHAIFSCKRSGFVRYRLLRAAINGCDVCQETWVGVGKLFNGGVIVKSGDTPGQHFRFGLLASHVGSRICRACAGTTDCRLAERLTVGCHRGIIGNNHMRNRPIYLCR